MTQDWDAARYARHARFVSDLGEPLVELLAPRAGERVLDLGCGDGALTAKLAGCGCRVVGVDGSESQVAAARERGLDACVMDAHALAFEAEFDAVFSNAALHWMKRPEAVIDGVWRALRPGGRFVAEMGGDGNVAAVRAALQGAVARRGLDPAALDPWYFPAPAEYAALLERRGFVIEALDRIPRPTAIGGDIDGWLLTFGRSFAAAIPEHERDAFRREVEETARPRLADANGDWTIDYVRLRFAAVKPGRGE